MRLCLRIPTLLRETMLITDERTIIKRHIADRGYSPRRCCPGRLFKTLLPFMTTSMNLAVDGPREDPCSSHIVRVAPPRCATPPHCSYSPLRDGHPAILHDGICKDDP